MKRSHLQLVEFICIACIFVGVTFYSVSYLTRNTQKIADTIKTELLQNNNKEMPPLYFYKVIGGKSDPIYSFSQSTTNSKIETKYSVELGICKSQECVHSKLEELEILGVKNIFYTATTNNSQVVYHIRKGIFRSKQGAKIAREALFKVLKINGAVIAL